MQKKLEAELAQFTGTEMYYRDLLSRFLYTDGVQFLLENYQCYWLSEQIFMYNLSCIPDEFQVWKLQRNYKDNQPTSEFALSMEDGNSNTLYSTIIPFSDFEADKVELWFSNNVLYLPSEH